jgi:2-aminoethylphosphonate-pyruvate transaminase
MDTAQLPDNPYILLTPGPLSTSKAVKANMLQDLCTWDDDYNNLVQKIRGQLVNLASRQPEDYTAVLMQGSGTFAVEACIGTAIPKDGKLLILANGHYGDRMGLIALCEGLNYLVQDASETGRIDQDLLSRTLKEDRDITHVAVVHCETTTGMLNPVDQIGAIVKETGRIYIVDAMSSFGGIPLDMKDMQADFLISSANKCIQGVPGFGFILARKSLMSGLGGNARSLSLDMYQQWRTMEEHNGKWRFTSPTHTVRAFAQALHELQEEGGPAARNRRYRLNHQLLVKGMRHLGFETLLPDEYQSPIITSFLNPDHPGFEFSRFYQSLKEQGFVIYPGKVTNAETFRIGNIGHVFPDDIGRLVQAVERAMYWK